MAIHAYFGLPGAGKSYGVVEYVVIPSLKEGRQVVTNIPLEGSLLTSVFGGEVIQLPDDWHEVEDLSSLCPAGCVLVLDEVWRKWPAGLNVNRVPKHEMALLKEHRHRVSSDGKAMRVVLVTQQPSDLATWTRKLVEVSYRMEKLTAVGLGKRFRVDIYKTCPTGDYPPKRLLIRQTQGTYKPEIYQYYRSATQSEAETLNVGDETIADKRGSIWRSKWLVFCLAIGLIFPVVGVWGVLDFFSQGAQEAPSEPPLVNPMPEPSQMAQIVPAAAPAPVQAVPAVEPVSLPSVPDVPSTPPISQTWRVGGFIGPADPDAGETPAAWDSIEGYNTKPKPKISQTKRVVLVGPFGHRYVDLERCHFYAEGIDVYCDVDGERITPWSGGGRMDGIVDSGISQAGQTVGVRTQQSEGRTPTD